MASACSADQHAVEVTAKGRNVAADTMLVPASSAVPRTLDLGSMPPHLRHLRDISVTCPRFADIFGPGFYVVETFGFGSCFFHALAAAVCPEYDWVHDTRKREAIGFRLRQSYLKCSNEQTYYDAMNQMHTRLHALQARCRRAPNIPVVPSYAVFERMLGEPSVWADLVLVSYISMAFNMNLVFFDDVVCDLYYGASRFEARKDVATIFINWNAQVHFELIVNINPRTNIVKRQFRYPGDRVVLERVMAAYNSCAGEA